MDENGQPKPTVEDRFEVTQVEGNSSKEQVIVNQD
jgi:hypothetical protein